MSRRECGTDWTSLSYILASQGRGWARLGVLWAALTGLQLLLAFVRARCVQGRTMPDCPVEDMDGDRTDPAIATKS